jgi:outer membrane protein TolC
MNRLTTAAILATAFLTAGLQAAAGKKNTPSNERVLPRTMSLDDCIRLSVMQNPQILAAKHQIEATRGQIITVRAQALPHLALGSGYNQDSPELINAQQQEKAWNITLQATQLVYSGGQVGAALKIARLTSDNNVYNLRDTINLVISNVRQQFYDLLLDKALIGVQEESAHLLESQLKDQKNRFQAGTVPRFNVLQAEVALANQIPLLIKAKNAYLISQITLATTLGVEYGTWHPGKTMLEASGELAVHERVINQEQAIESAKQMRPSLQLQRQNILIQLQQIKVALAGYQPQISVNAGWELRNSGTSKELDATVNGWFFGATGNWAIFDGLATYGNVKTARANLETAKVNYDNAVLQVELQVQQAIANLDQARQTIQSQTKNVEEALEAVRLSQERLSAGAGTQLDVLNAQVALAQARTNELQAKHDYNSSLAQFDYAIGMNTQYEPAFDDPLAEKKPVAPKPASTNSQAKP